MATFRARLSTLTSCSPSRCLRSRSSFDARVHIRGRVLPSSVPTLSRETSLGSLLRVHDQELLAALTSSCLPCSPCDAHGRHPSAHSPRAREFVSRFDERVRRPSSVRRSRPRLAPGISTALAFRQKRSPCRTASACHAHLATVTSRVRRTMTRFEPARLSTSMLETDHRCACVHLSFWTDFRSQPELPRPIRTLRCVPAASTPALRSTCISRRSRPVGTSVLTFAQRVRGCSRSLSRPVLTLRCSRSEPLPAIHVHAHVQSHLAVFEAFRLRYLFGGRSFRHHRPETSCTFRYRPSRDVEHPAILQHLSASDLS